MSGGQRAQSGSHPVSARQAPSLRVLAVAIALLAIAVLLVGAVLARACVTVAATYPRVQAALQWMSGWYRNAPAEEKTWWHDVATQEILMAQQITLFLRVENVEVPAPFSWIVKCFDFLTLQPVASLFFSPCAFVSYQNTLVFVYRGRVEF